MKLLSEATKVIDKLTNKEIVDISELYNLDLTKLSESNIYEDSYFLENNGTNTFKGFVDEKFIVKHYKIKDENILKILKENIGKKVKFKNVIKYETINDRIYIPVGEPIFEEEIEEKYTKEQRIIAWSIFIGVLSLILIPLVYSFVTFGVHAVIGSIVLFIFLFGGFFVLPFLA